MSHGHISSHLGQANLPPAPVAHQESGLRAGAAVLLLQAALLLSAMLLSPPAFSRWVLDLDTKDQPVALNDWGDYWIERGSQSTPAQVYNAPNITWQPTEREMIYPVKGGDALWVRFNVPPAPDAERWYLEVPNPSINRASLYTLNSAGQWDQQTAGDLTAVSQWPVPHRHPLLPIALSAEVPTSYLLRLENGNSFSAPLQFVSQSHMSNAEQRISLIFGIFFGLTGLAALISALSAVSLRDPAHGFYALSVTLMALIQASMTGLAGMHLWPDSPQWNDLVPSVLPTLGLSTLLLCVSAAVFIADRSGRLHRTMVSVAVFGVGVAMLLALVPFEYRMRVFVSYNFLPQFLGAYALFWAWRHGDRFAPWLILGFSPVVVPSVWLMARNAGLVPISFMTQYGGQIGVAIELPIILVILMLRSQLRRENIRRIQERDRLDPATSLINDQMFAERMVRMMARALRLRHESAVIIIDIVNTDQIQRDFGRKAADELPLHVAERLLSTAREIDSATRLSERRFGMLIEGPFSSEDAASLVLRVVGRCLMPYKGMHMNCTAQVRVIYALVPYQDFDAQRVLSALEDRLASVSETDKRTVFMLGEGPRPPPLRRVRLRRLNPFKRV